MSATISNNPRVPTEAAGVNKKPTRHPKEDKARRYPTEYTKTPVVSGFGIKNEEDVKTFSKSKADGIVLGSAIVKEIQKKSNETGDKHIVANFIKDYCRKLIKNLNK